MWGAFLFVGFMRVFKYSLTCLLMSLLSACQGINASTDTLGVVFSSAINSNKTMYVPGFEYIEVELNGNTTALALGYRKVEGADIEEHWYSGVGEMLTLRNGRLVEVLGMIGEVRQTSREIPKWDQLEANHSPLTWMRTRNLHPGYRYGVKEYVTSEAKVNKKVNRQTNQTWVLETVQSERADGREWRYEEKFQLENGRVVFSEQCLTPSICFKLKPLGVVVKQ